MYVLGICGGMDAIHETRIPTPRDQAHDAAAVLLKDGEIIAAIEEERLTRIKHTNKRPTEAMRFCLRSAGISLADLDRVSFYTSEAYLDRALGAMWFERSQDPVPWTTRALLERALQEDFGVPFDTNKLDFVSHHEAHAMSALAMSGFPRALVITLDGQGEQLSGTVSTAERHQLKLLRTMGDDRSLGWFYTKVIGFLGYGAFDEYKVMGLAPYGDPSLHRELLGSLFELKPEGEYLIHFDRLPRLLSLGRPRRRGEPFTQLHRDVAASLQEALELIAFHLVRHFVQLTGERNLCLAGGVAHNCTLNGKLLSSGLFDHVFVQPAAHDAGCALGAALSAYYKSGASAPMKPCNHVYWGSTLEASPKLEDDLRRWGDWCEVERVADPSLRAAELLASGAVIGWVQGKSEFGPRALGHRSILADPRPEANKTRINAMVKKREGYRPFAPSVLEEKVRDYFVVPEHHTRLPFMTFVVGVKEDQRAMLGAITHVDGTARVQTVARADDEAYWNLIHAFGERTGTYLVLNTSFNNNIEPIVESAADAVACFLTTQIDHLVIGELVLTKRSSTECDAALFRMVPVTPPYVRLQASRGHTPSQAGYAWRHECAFTYERSAIPLSASAFTVLSAADDASSIETLMARTEQSQHRAALHKELMDLWSERALELRPPG